MQIIAPGMTSYSAPVFSRDGAYLYYFAYSGDESDNTLYQIPARGGESRRLFTAPEANGHISVSPDGEHLAFVEDNGPMTAVIFDVVPPRISATVAGAYLLFIHLAGDAIALPLVGTLSDRFGLDQAILLLPAVVIVGGVVALFATRTVRQDMSRVESAVARLAGLP